MPREVIVLGANHNAAAEFSEGGSENIDGRYFSEPYPRFMSGHSCAMDNTSSTTFRPSPLSAMEGIMELVVGEASDMPGRPEELKGNSPERPYETIPFEQQPTLAMREPDNDKLRRSDELQTLWIAGNVQYPFGKFVALGILVRDPSAIVGLSQTDRTIRSRKLPNHTSAHINIDSRESPVERVEQLVPLSYFQPFPSPSWSTFETPGEM
ncbi:hypothetical protein AJ78_01355 [Emergomyces pasteurianus Ep9510]|uniref:Uncharacterized protein n=1 Tax=Emergomyces pasteurianus Ep9510 TaxID=1447872 RepID=A0A1J9QEN7_9EURO|nr:hypothetical protein AJ78_01355 [Emergomyces pasteurianus Ep9510]